MSERICTYVKKYFGVWSGVCVYVYMCVSVYEHMWLYKLLN